ncbi:MAG: hypothetical protein AAFR81_12715 [Chloroflexota bacterium]
MMRHRMQVVILCLAVLLLTACSGANEPLDIDLLRAEACDNLPQVSSIPPDRAIDDTSNEVFVQLIINLMWISPNPNLRWAVAGSELQVRDDVTTRILFRETEIQEEQEGLSFEELLYTVAAPEAINGVTDDGMPYGCDVDPIGNRIIYRQNNGYMLEIILTDLNDDQIDIIYISEWQIIALQGGVLLME